MSAPPEPTSVAPALRRLLWLCRGLGVAVIAAFLATSFTPLPNIIYRSLQVAPQEGPAEAIVALGAGIEQDGVLSSSSVQRCLHAILLQRRGLAPLLVLLGPRRGNGPTEADVRAKLARDLGIDAAAILAEGRARTTREEAQYSRELLKARGISRILLVTGGHHMRRAQAVFQAVGFEVLPAPVEEISSESSRPESRFGLARASAMELAGRVYYRLAGFLRQVAVRRLHALLVMAAGGAQHGLVIDHHAFASATPRKYRPLFQRFLRSRHRQRFIKNQLLPQAVADGAGAGGGIEGKVLRGQRLVALARRRAKIPVRMTLTQSSPGFWERTLGRLPPGPPAIGATSAKPRSPSARRFPPSRSAELEFSHR